jgi:Domain of unknown function (DUF4062)
VKIYISSTQLDLAEHRLAVTAGLRRAGHDVIGMEDYLAEGAKPVDKCVRDVLAADVYVVLVAWRYGFVPELATASAAETQPCRSITETEYEAARNAQKPILAFVADPSAPWPPNLADGITGENDHGASVAEFRERLGRDHLVSSFSSPEQLVTQVLQAMGQHEIGFGITARAVRVARREPFKLVSEDEGLTDSATYAITQAIVESGDADVLEVGLGAGRSWWSTRLYLLAALAADLTDIEQFVFTGRERNVIGLATLHRVRRRLVEVHTALASLDARFLADDPSGDTAAKTHDRLAAFNRHFRRARGVSAERRYRVWVTPRRIGEWLRDDLVLGSIRVGEPGGSTAARVQQLLEWPWRFVPVEHDAANDDAEPGESALTIVDRDAFGRQLAREWVARELPRSPAR